ncbi:MAG: phosphatidate cytidylyltransferase [Nitrospirae bacterium]|nr:phosphatidate cytidylyltransferase [Nitrospirota bacterium]
MHIKRVIVAAIALPIFYVFITKLPPLYFFGLLLLVSSAAQIEFHSMYNMNKTLSFLGVAGGVIVLLSAIASSSPFVNLYPSSLILAFIFISAVRLFYVKDPSFSLRDISPAIVGILYIPNLLLPQWHLRLLGYEWILFLYGSVWASDSAAYYIGKGFGRKKLYKEVSPNKTIAGAFGSLAGGVLSAIIIGGLIFSMTDVLRLIIIGLCIGSTTIVGDLVESMFKRDADVKDSGVIIPGHGGILDKIDGVLFAGPVLYWITRFL